MLQLATDKITMVVCILGEFVYYLAQLLMKHHCKNYYLQPGLFSTEPVIFNFLLMQDLMQYLIFLWWSSICQAYKLCVGLYTFVSK